MSGEMAVMNGREYLEPHDCFVLDGREYSLAEVREAIALLNEAVRAERQPQSIDQ